MTDNPGDRTIAMLSHLLGIITGFLGPLVVFLAQLGKPYVRDHAAEALNFQITVIIAFVGAAIPSIIAYLALVAVDSLLLLTLILWWVVAIGDLVFAVIAAVMAYRGRPYRYPVGIHFIRPSPVA